MARPERFELPTFWFVAVAAREISNLYRSLLNATEYAECHIGQGVENYTAHSVAFGRG